MMVSIVPNTNLLLWGIVIHLIADWIFQNQWMADNKSSLKHPAAYVHSGIHLIALLIVFPPLAAVLLAVSHLLIDTRKPLQWWRSFFRQTQDGPAALHVAMWGDQVLHIAMIALAVVLLGIQGKP